MKLPVYEASKRWVGIDVWRGLVVVTALIIHMTQIKPEPDLIAWGDFFSGYASIGVVFGGIAGMMGYGAYGRQPFKLRDCIRREWRRAGVLIITYLIYYLVLQELGLSGGQWLSIYCVLAGVYLVAPLYWWLTAKVNRSYASGLIVIMMMTTARLLMETAKLPGLIRNLGFDYWLNTTPLLPVIAVYGTGALIMELKQRGRLTRPMINLAWGVIALYAPGRYWLNSLDIYPNQQFVIRLSLMALLAVGFVGLKPKHWPKGLLALAYLGQQSFWVFTVGNLLLALWL